VKEVESLLMYLEIVFKRSSDVFLPDNYGLLSIFRVHNYGSKSMPI